MNLKCCPCTDEHITKDQDDDAIGIPDAITIVPTMQTFSVGGQQMTAPIALPVCYACRQKMLGKVSRAGLLTA